MTTTDKLIFVAGKERGIAIAYLAQAKLAIGERRARLVRLAREAGRESVRYIKAARGDV